MPVFLLLTRKDEGEREIERVRIGILLGRPKACISHTGRYSIHFIIAQKVTRTPEITLI